MLKKLFLLFLFFSFSLAKSQTITFGGINYNVISGTTNVEIAANNCYPGNLTIPESISDGITTYAVTSIGGNAFSNCQNLTSVTIPNSVKTIGFYAFEGCGFLTSVTIPDSVTYIGVGTFNLCTRLNSIKIPDSVTKIDLLAFGNCSGLTTVIIPKSVEFMGGAVFANCTGLTSVICKIKVPLNIAPDVWENVNLLNCSLTVPEASVDAYKTSLGWREFNPILPDLSSSLNTAENNAQNNSILYPNPIHHEAILELKNSNNSKLEIYDMNGKMVLRKSLINNSKNTIDTSNLPKGLYLFKVGKSVTKVIKD